MQSLSNSVSEKRIINRNKIAFLGAVTLLFSYAEMLFPRIIPFFRIGLGNAALLLAFTLNFPSYFVLLLLKTFASSLMAGTLFSPFVLVSLGQSVASGIFMYGLFHLDRLTGKKLFSVYGISVLGSSLSAFVQIYLSSLYLGAGTMVFLGPMLIFNLVTGIVTAFLSTLFTLPESIPLPEADEESEKQENHSSRKTVIFSVFLLIFACSVFFIDNVFVLCGIFCFSIVLQILSRRKILVLPHVFLWLFVVISSLFESQGEVLFTLGSFSVTAGALIDGVKKALKLSSVTCISQCLSGLNISKKYLPGLSLFYYRKMHDRFFQTKGSLIQRLKSVLDCTE